MTHPDKSNRPNQRSPELSALIEQLADRSPTQREPAVLGIFRIGRERAIRCTGSWFLEAAVASFFIFDTADFPRTTVGVAVQPESFDRIRTANGLPPMAHVPPDLDAKEFEINAGGDVRLDILTTRDAQGSGAIARFLRKFGEGIQQVELNVYDVDQAVVLLRERFRIEPVYPNAREGADGSRVNFILVSDQDEKLLIELVESPART